MGGCVFQYGKSALMEAVQRDFSEMVGMLLIYGANANITANVNIKNLNKCVYILFSFLLKIIFSFNQKGQSALMRAVDKDNVKIVRLLVNAGATFDDDQIV